MPDKPEDDLPVRDVMLGWIETHWDALAAFAWAGYVGAGRGIVLLKGDWHGAVVVGYQTAAEAEAAGAIWPDELLEAVQHYTPATDILFLAQLAEGGALIAMRATPPRLPPSDAGQRDGSPPLVPSA